MRRNYKRHIILMIIMTAALGIFFYIERTGEVEGIKGREEVYDEVWEVKENERVEEFIIELGGDWKEYTDKKYVPEIPEYYEQEEEVTTNTTTPTTYTEGKNIKDILAYLNPYNLNHKSITSKGWNMRYGVTQINLKLLPLANYYFNDFETNPNSQIDFLEMYIDVKTNAGKTVNQIIESYITGEDN